MSDVDFIEEIRIAQFWRKQLGEYEYVDYNPDDLRRWFTALETRGPVEIRDYLIERTGRHPAGQVTGIVSTAPHPPLNIIELWLASYNKVNTRPLWFAGTAFLVFTYYFTTSLAGCQSIRPMTQLQRSPPQIGAINPNPNANNQSAPASIGSTLPAQLRAPSSAASPPTGNPSTQSGNQSGPAH